MMLERKLYKTKLCILFQKGRCTRQSCSFAHGETELRRFGGSFGGRRGIRGSDLRERLGRRYSPHRKYSPARDARVRRAFHGYSRSRSPGGRSERRTRRKYHLDGQSDGSGSREVSAGEDDNLKDRRRSSSEDKNLHEEKLKQAKEELKLLHDHKCQLEVDLDEKDQEVESLKSRIEELKLQLYKEQEDSRRIASRVMKFIKAHKRYSRAQQELKRTQGRLQRLGDRFSSDVVGNGAYEEDSSVNIVSDGDPVGHKRVSPDNEPHRYMSPMKKRQRTGHRADEGKSVTSTRRDLFLEETTGSERIVQQSGPALSGSLGRDVVTQGKNVLDWPLENNERGMMSSSPMNASADKYNGEEEQVDVEAVDAEIGDDPHDQY